MERLWVVMAVVPVTEEAIELLKLVVKVLDQPLRQLQSSESVLVVQREREAT